ncbi:MAG TPA: hypothetical protein VN132_07585 [Bdellovibrio sp.]|nr:hypothetical protein [Bdellovibrio sp.]
MKTFALSLLLSLFSVAALANVEYVCTRSFGEKLTMTLNAPNKITFHNSGGVYGELVLKPELSNNTQLVFVGISNSPLGHDAVEVTYAFEPTIALGAQNVVGAFRSGYYGPGDASVIVKCVKQP